MRSIIFAENIPSSCVKLQAPPFFSTVWRMDSIPIPLPARLEDWKILFFCCILPIEGVLHMNQKQMIMVGINLHINLSAGGYCFHYLPGWRFPADWRTQGTDLSHLWKDQQAGKPLHEKECSLSGQGWNNIRKHCQQPDFHRNAG